MKARVKATGENIEVMQVYEKGESFYVRLDMLDTIEVRYHISELEFEGFETEGKFAETCLNGIKQDIVYKPDYWTRLKHQAAIAAMRELVPMVNHGYEYVHEETAIVAYNYANALIGLLKKEDSK